ncbi:hypothetical protein [Runella sp.]|uniref:hypothetical protein n=1 Tax=Runella sp. TaxID=1960881 RepID=UPI00262E8B60|nr:hypothetical protein [Runella sp.]
MAAFMMLSYRRDLPRFSRLIDYLRNEMYFGCENQFTTTMTVIIPPNATEKQIETALEKLNKASKTFPL